MPELSASVGTCLNNRSNTSEIVGDKLNYPRHAWQSHHVQAVQAHEATDGQRPARHLTLGRRWAERVPAQCAWAAATRGARGAAATKGA